MAKQRLDYLLQSLEQYPQTLPRRLPGNVKKLPNHPIIDRAPIPMNFMFHTLKQIRDGIPIKTPASRYGKDRLWVSNKEHKAILLQNQPDLPVHVLGQPVLTIDNTRKRLHLRRRKRSHLPPHIAG